MSSMNTPPPAPETKTNSILSWNPLTWVSILGGLLLVALIVVLTVLFTGGDGDKDEPTPQPTVTVTSEPEEPKETVEAKDLTPNFDAVPKQDPTTEKGFAAFARDIFPVLEDATDKEITDIANKTCDLLDEGKSWPEALALAGKHAENVDEGGAYGGVSGMAVDLICTEHMDKLEPYL